MQGEIAKEGKALLGIGKGEIAHFFLTTSSLLASWIGTTPCNVILGSLSIVGLVDVSQAKLCRKMKYEK